MRVKYQILHNTWELYPTVESTVHTKKHLITWRHNRCVLSYRMTLDMDHEHVCAVRIYVLGKQIVLNCVLV